MDALSFILLIIGTSILLGAVFRVGMIYGKWRHENMLEAKYGVDWRINIQRNKLRKKKSFKTDSA